MTSNKVNNFFLIGGTGRSGTTILCRAFGQHPGFTDVPEWRFMTDPDGIIDFSRHSDMELDSPFHYDRRVKRLDNLLRSIGGRSVPSRFLGTRIVRKIASSISNRNLSPAYARTNADFYSPNFDQYRIELIANLRDWTYEGYWIGMEFLESTRISFSTSTSNDRRTIITKFLRSVAADVCAHQGAIYHLEKNTWNTLWFSEILKVLPEARLVHIVRDPRDVVTSFMNQPWGPKDAVVAAKLYSKLNESWWEVRSRVPADSYLELRLEDLVSDPEDQYKKICNFWNVEYRDELLAVRLSASSFGRWKTDLTPKEIDDVTNLTFRAIEHYNYSEASD